jgi:hypothetical protein
MRISEILWAMTTRHQILLFIAQSCSEPVTTSPDCAQNNHRNIQDDRVVQLNRAASAAVFRLR